MVSYATATNNWDEDKLAGVPIEAGFRLRGLEVTRLDTFVDAAFAFVLTLLVISFDDIPSNYVEMMDAILKIPAFLASFVVLMIFWLSHRGWSRRFGLETTATLLLSLGVIFTILVYVYPLRMVFESMFHWMSGGFFSSSITIESMAQLRAIFNYYSAGFLVMSVLFALLYLATLRHQESLSLNASEIKDTRENAIAWWVCAVVAILSITLANLASAQWVTAAGWVYSFIYPFIYLTTRVLSRGSRPAA